MRNLHGQDTEHRLQINASDLRGGTSIGRFLLGALGVAVLGFMIAAGILWFALPKSHLQDGAWVPLSNVDGSIEGLDNLAAGVVAVIMKSGDEEIQQGSGCVMTVDDGIATVVTNWHVLSPPPGLPAEKLSLEILHRNKPVGKVISAAVPPNREDLLALEVRLSPGMTNTIRPLPMRAQDGPPLKPLDEVVVVGNPYGLEHSYTTGAISAIRDNTSHGKEIQIDASVWPGNSGGPVFARIADDSYQWIGVVRAKSMTGIHFAIHVDTIRLQEYYQVDISGSDWSRVVDYMEFR
ncbi:MAG: serine protease [Phycisphaerales bacterium]|nr:serine protease [Phycisphaerales bacterium]